MFIFNLMSYITKVFNLSLQFVKYVIKCSLYICITFSLLYVICIFTFVYVWNHFIYCIYFV